MRTPQEKIKSIEEFLPMVRGLKEKGQTLVECDGVFDLVHPAHIHYFTQARQQGDILYVAVVADAFVQKGNGRPLFTDKIRALWIAGIEAVDFVVINNDYGPYKIIEQVHPDIIVKGESYREKPTDGFLRDKTLVESYGGRVFFSNELDIHSTDIIKKICDIFGK